MVESPSGEGKTAVQRINSRGPSAARVSPKFVISENSIFIYYLINKKSYSAGWISPLNRTWGEGKGKAAWMVAIRWLLFSSAAIPEQLDEEIEIKTDQGESGDDIHDWISFACFGFVIYGYAKKGRIILKAREFVGENQSIAEKE
ncbi:MAG: hypothetical protein HPY51_06615 [Candidatus Omnitrophica bacterium]|nr:hypothetical protein [Candidatus Omnitrophota bacterium]